MNGESSLFVLRRTGDRLALKQLQEEGAAVLLLQDAVLMGEEELPTTDIYHSAEDARLRGVEAPGVPLSYAEIIELFERVARVLLW